MNEPLGRERYCYRDFKDNPTETWIDGVRLLLCRGCAYDLKAVGNFLRTNGLGIRQILVPEGELEGVVKGEGEARDRVVMTGFYDDTVPPT